MRATLPTLVLALALLAAPAPPTADRHVRGEDAPFGTYVPREVRGWTVHVHPTLARVDHELGRAALELLDHELFEVTRALPRTAVERLRAVPIWLSLGDPHWPGGVYHPSRAWLASNGHDPRVAGGIQFGSAANLLAWERDQPAMLVHELAHAWHHQVLGHDFAPLLEAFAAAREAGTYEAVLRESGATERAYALTNPQEYFAEASEAFFGANDFFPFVRAELAAHDPQGYAAVRAAWEVVPAADR